ncbi:MAG TPA: hypothetical protein VNX25_03425 [Verrucomicrobiae bacterium]|nr:hypothetical protein [Verrucomicrobiae bacterium]
MYLKLHGNATTTPKIRSYIQLSGKDIHELVQELGVTETTVRRWKSRNDTSDRSCRPHTIHRGLTLNEEEVVIALRMLLQLPLDELLEVARRYVNAACSRAGLHRLLKRRNLPPLRETLRDLGGNGWYTNVARIVCPEGKEGFCVLAAVEETSRWVFAEAVHPGDASARRLFAERLLKYAPVPVAEVAVCNDEEGSVADALLVCGVRVVPRSTLPVVLHLDPVPRIEEVSALLRSVTAEYNRLAAGKLPL